jgi:hypothetical protein
MFSLLRRNYRLRNELERIMCTMPYTVRIPSLPAHDAPPAIA